MIPNKTKTQNKPNDTKQNQAKQKHKQTNQMKPNKHKIKQT